MGLLPSVTCFFTFFFTFFHFLFFIMQHTSIKAPSKALAMLLAGTISLVACSSATVIESVPSGAKLYINGEPVGTTPYTHRDTRIVGSTNLLRLEREGYTPLSASFSRDEEADVGAIIGGIFVLVPFLWAMKYKPAHRYELSPATPVGTPSANPNEGQGKSKLEKLQILQQLLEKKAITQEEFEQEKKKILAESGK